MAWSFYHEVGSWLLENTGNSFSPSVGYWLPAGSSWVPLYLVGYYRQDPSFEDLRAQLIEMIWQDDAPSPELPTVEIGYVGLSYASSFPAEVSRVDRLMATTPRGGSSEMHLIHPLVPLNRVAIVHGGHGEHYYTNDPDPGTNSAALVTALLQAGWHVLGVCMPIDGFNNILGLGQTYDLANGGTVNVTNHDQFSILEADGMGTIVLRIFLDGALQGINYLETLAFDRIAMTGISGGGWTTDLLAALDTRIVRSYPTYGSLPFDLRALVGGSATGDYEQIADGVAPFWLVADDYTNLYILSALDAGRRRLQYLGDQDSVFTAAAIHSELSELAADIDEDVPAGQHTIAIDATTVGHRYGAATIAAIVADAAGGLGPFDYIESLYGAGGIVRCHWAGSLSAGAVASWPDETGSGFPAVQGTTAKRPTASTAGAFSYVSGDAVAGANAKCLEGTLTLSAGGSFTVFVVRRAHAADTDHGIVDVSDGNVTNRAFQLLHTSGAMNARMAGANPATNNNLSLTWKVWAAVYRTTDRRLIEFLPTGGTTETVNTTDSAAIATDRYRLMCLYQDVLPGDDDLAHVILMNREATADEIQRVGAELLHVYVM